MTRSLNALPFGLAIWLCAITFVANSHVASAQEPPKNFVLLDKPNLVAEINFGDGEGHARKLTDFKGKIVLLNIWATWCIPCRKEMPALDRLQASLGSANFEVVPVSIDRGGLEVIRKFYIEVGIRNLAMYVDSSGQVLGRVRALGLPTSLLIDRSGEEIGRVIGPAEWDAPEIMAFIRCFVSPHDAAASQSLSKPTETRICSASAQP
jgi:thiol-disulfide isomerase/thioredoxin